MSTNALQSFYEFCRTVDGPFCDFEVVENEKQWLNSLLLPEAESFLKVIGMQKNGSLICFWSYEDELSLEQQPIVWLDSEGSPNAVFASNILSFLSILPYDTGAIYDVLFAWQEYWSSSRKRKKPTSEFAKKMKMYLEMSQEDYPFHNQFVEWLRTEIGLEPATNPAQLIGEAVEHFPRLDVWLNERQLIRHIE